MGKTTNDIWTGVLRIRAVGILPRKWEGRSLVTLKRQVVVDIGSVKAIVAEAA